MKYVSVIIPVYNVSRYLGHCLNSVIKQSYKNFHIILVNDHSTDDSLDICNLYKRNYSDRIFLIDKQKNEGVDKARFSGLELALKTNPDGYVMFVDSDDWIETDAIQTLIDTATATDADIVSMQSKRFFFPGAKFKQKSYVGFGLFNKHVLQEKLFVSFFGCNLLPTYMWGKLYKIKVLKEADLKPSKYRMCEDHMFNMYLYPFVKSWCNIDYYGYIYRYGGMTSRFNPLWPELRDQNIDKRIFANKLGYLNNVQNLLDIELKNIFFTDAIQRLNHCSTSEFMTWLKFALDDKVWQHTIDSRTLKSNNDFQSIYNKDIPAIINIIKNKNKQNPVKSLGRKIFTLLNKWLG